MLVSRTALCALALAALPLVATQDETPPPPRQGTFFAITTPDADASAAWYTQHLGFELVSQHDLTERRLKMRNLMRDGAWLELIERPDAKDQREDGIALGFFKAGFYVDDVAALHKSLTDAEVKVDDLLEDDGTRFFTMRDPDGNRLQVFERHK